MLILSKHGFVSPVSDAVFHPITMKVIPMFSERPEDFIYNTKIKTFNFYAVEIDTKRWQNWSFSQCITTIECKILKCKAISDSRYSQ